MAVNRLNKSGVPTACTLGPQNALAGSPKTGSMLWGTVTTVSQLASWAMGARPEVVLPTHHSGERRESGLAGGLLGRFRGEGSSLLSLWARVLVTT